MKTEQLMAAFLFTLALCGCTTFNQQPPTLRPDQKGHRASAIAFPATVGLFPRGEVKLYDAAGEDIGAGYDLRNLLNPVAITVYVYPGPKLLSIGSPPEVIATARKHLTDNHFEAIKRELIKYHPQASATADEEVHVIFRGQSLYGRAAAFRSEELFAGRIQPVVTCAEIYAYGKWIIKFRATYPAATEKSGGESARTFVKDFIRANELTPD